jgi:hypothetical protein
VSQIGSHGCVSFLNDRSIIAPGKRFVKTHQVVAKALEIAS